MFAYFDARWIASHQRRKTIIWTIVAFLAVVVVAVEGISFLRLAQVASKSPLTAQQKLALAQAKNHFPIRQPTWLPVSTQLADVTGTNSCAASVCPGSPQTVLLEYVIPLNDAAPWVYFELSECDCPISFQMSYQDAQGRVQSMNDAPSNITLNDMAVHVDELTGDTADGPIQTDVLSWSQDGVYYSLRSDDIVSGATDLATLEHIVSSLIV
jgi:hypothetical protein